MEHILRVLNKHNGNKPAAAAELGIVLKTLYNKLNQWEEERRRTRGSRLTSPERKRRASLPVACAPGWWKASHD